MTAIADGPNPSATRASADSASVSIIVPAVRADAELRRCLESVARLDPPALELIVAVDGGDEQTQVLARSLGARVTALPVRRGPAAARNAAARLARGAILFFVDADVALWPDAAGQVSTAFDKDPGIDAVMGSYDTQPSAPNFLSQYKNLAHHFVHQAAREEASTFWSGCGAIRRDRFLALGGFDETYRRPCIEDIELGTRLIAEGGRIRLVKTLQASHMKRWTPLGLLRSELIDRAYPWTRLILRAGRMPNDLNLRWSGRLAVIAAVLLAGSLLLAPLMPLLLWSVPALATVLALIDASLARFLARERGTMFALRALGWQWLHYLCSAAGFAAGLTAHAMVVLQARLAVPVPDTRVAGEQESD